jgi:hypothetical protein
MGTTTMKKRHTTHTQPHKPLLVGWIVHGLMTTTTMTSNSSKTTEEVMRTRETEQKKGPRDVDDVSWATGIVFIVFSHFIFTLLTNVLGTSLNYWQ